MSVLLDISASFDTVDHGIPVDMLRQLLVSWQLFLIMLVSIRPSVCGCLVSKQSMITSEVPQGSVLGLFNAKVSRKRSSYFKIITCMHVVVTPTVRPNEHFTFLNPR